MIAWIFEGAVVVYDEVIDNDLCLKFVLFCDNDEPRATLIS